MPRVLRVFDCSNYVSAGSEYSIYANGVTAYPGGQFGPKEMPIGGVNFLLNVIHEFNYEDTDLVFTFDSTPTIKRELFESLFPGQQYKGNRPRAAKHIGYQRKMARAIIEDIGFNALFLDGYEGDDLINHVVANYKDSYSRVIIHARDSDLSSLVDTNVEIMPVGDKGKYITVRNYEEAVIKDKILPYNTIQLDKLCRGDRGDNIPGIPPAMVKRVLDGIPENLYPMLGNYTLLRKWVENAVDGDPRVMGTLDLLLPLEIPREEYIELNETFFDESKYIFYCNLLGNKYYRRANSVSPYQEGLDLVNGYLDLFWEV